MSKNSLADTLHKDELFYAVAALVQTHSYEKVRAYLDEFSSPFRNGTRDRCPSTGVFVPAIWILGIFPHIDDLESRLTLRQCSKWLHDNVGEVSFRVFVAALDGSSGGRASNLQQRLVGTRAAFTAKLRAAPASLPRMKYRLPLKYLKLPLNYFHSLKSLCLDVPSQHIPLSSNVLMASGGGGGGGGGNGVGGGGAFGALMNSANSNLSLGSSTTGSGSGGGSSSSIGGALSNPGAGVDGAAYAQWHAAFGLLAAAARGAAASLETLTVAVVDSGAAAVAMRRSKLLHSLPKLKKLTIIGGYETRSPFEYPAAHTALAQLQLEHHGSADPANSENDSGRGDDNSQSLSTSVSDEDLSALASNTSSNNNGHPPFLEDEEDEYIADVYGCIATLMRSLRALPNITSVSLLERPRRGQITPTNYQQAVAQNVNNNNNNNNINNNNNNNNNNQHPQLDPRNAFPPAGKRSSFLAVTQMLLHLTSLSLSGDAFAAPQSVPSKKALQLPNLKELTVAHYEQSWRTLPLVPSLQRIDLSLRHREDEQHPEEFWKNVALLRDLRALSVHAVPLFPGMRAIDTLTRLEELQVYNVDLTLSDDLSALLPQLSKLRRVDLSFVHLLSERAQQCLRALPPTLTSLKVNAVCDAASLAQLTALQTLEISRPSIMPMADLLDAEWLARSVPRLPNLTAVSLHGCPRVDDDALDVLAALPRLRWLRLSHAPNAKLLSRLGASRSLRIFSFAAAFAPASDDAADLAAELEELARSSHIRQIDLNGAVENLVSMSNNTLASLCEKSKVRLTRRWGDMQADVKRYSPWFETGQINKII